MVVRIHNPSKWRRVEAGQLLHLPGDHMRKLRIELNAPSQCRVDLVAGEDDPRPFFLASFTGREDVEFQADGDVYLSFSGPDEVWFSTLDGTAIGYDSALKSFTKPFSRAPRNHDLEVMMFKLEQNARRREAQQMDLVRAMMAQQQGANVDTGEFDDTDVAAGSASEPADDAAIVEPAVGKKPGAKAGTAKAPVEGSDDGAGA